MYLGTYVRMNVRMHVCTRQAHSWPKPVFLDRRALKMMQGKNQIRRADIDKTWGL